MLCAGSPFLAEQVGRYLDLRWCKPKSIRRGMSILAWCYAAGQRQQEERRLVRTEGAKATTSHISSVRSNQALPRRCMKQESYSRTPAASSRSL